MKQVGRIVYGVAIAGFGAVCLGYADFVNSLQPVPAAMFGYTPLAILTGVILLVCGIAISSDQGTSAAARVLIAVFLSWVVLLQIPSAFLQPQLLRSPWWIRTFETVALTGAAFVLAASGSGGRWVRTGRILYGLSLPVFGALHLIYPASVAALIPVWYPWPMFLAYFTGISQIVGGLAIAAGVVPRVAAILAGVMYGSWALTLHVPRNWCRVFGPCELLPLDVVGLRNLRPEMTSMFVAIAMCGAAWIVAGSVLRSINGGDSHAADGSTANRSASVRSTPLRTSS